MQAREIKLAHPAQWGNTADADPELEQLVLGIPLVRPETLPQLLQAVQDPRLFSDERHRLIFRAMRELAENGNVISWPALRDALERQGCLAEVGGDAYLERLLEFPRSLDYPYFLERFIRAARWRFIREAVQAADPEADPVRFLLDLVGQVGRPKAQFLEEADGPMETTWIWEPYIPRRHLTLLEGATDAGKTWVALYVALSAARDGLAVLYVTDEHDPPELKARLEQLGASKADLGRICYLGDPTLEGLEAEARLRAYGLIVVDPITDLVPARLNPNLPTVGRAVLSPLRRLAAETGAAVLAVRHWSKAVNSDVPALARGLGSTAFAAKARSILHVGRLPKAATAYAMVHVKSNLGPRGPALEYRLDPNAERPFTWVGIRENLTPQDIGLSDVERSELDRAKAWLQAFLADGPRQATEVEEAAEAEGFSKMTLRRAKEALGVLSIRSGGRGGRWAWRLPTPIREGETVKMLKTPSYIKG